MCDITLLMLCSSPSKYAGQLLELSFFQQFGQHLTQEAHCGLI